MSRSWVGAALSERLYQVARLLALGLAYLLKALWKAFGLDGGKNSPGVVTSFLDRALDLVEYYHELSLALHHEYFVLWSVSENPTHILDPLVGPDGEPFRARWGAMETVVSEDLDSLAEPVLNGRISSVPGATELLVDERAYADVHDVDSYPRVAEVMGREFAGELVDVTDEPVTVDEPEGFDPPVSEPRDPIVLIPDPSPVRENNVRTRLQIKGPDNLEKQTAALHDAEYLDEDEKRARIQDKSDKSWVRTANAATTLADAGVDFVNAAAASQEMGVVRVLGPNPCSFCVALASLGVIYEQGHWDKSNAKFRKSLSRTGKPMQGGNAKVHDGCQCRLVPVPLGADESELPAGVAEAQALWKKATGRMPKGYSWTEQYHNFRRMFRDGEFTNMDIEFERPEMMTRREEIRFGVTGTMVHLAFLQERHELEPEREDVARRLEFYRQQLEYQLQRWEKWGDYETDWVKEYEWMELRMASMVDPDFRRKYREVYGDEAENDRSYLFNEWLIAKHPDYQDHKAYYWPNSPERPDMPEFR